MDERSGLSGTRKTGWYGVMLHCQNRVQKCLKHFQFKEVNKKEDAAVLTSTKGDNGNYNEHSSSFLDISLERQMEPWKANPIWSHEIPDIKVTVPKGSLCNLSVSVNLGLPPDAVYNIVTDPDNQRVFKNIKEVISRRVVVDEGHRQVVEVEQAALWKFLWWSGTISVHLLVDQNKADRTMKFTQIKTGFMKRFEGCWRMEPLFVDEELCHPNKPNNLSEYLSYTNGKGRIGSRVNLEQLVQPSIVPPPPISWYLRGITAKTTEMIITDLLAEAARLRGVSRSEDSRGFTMTSERASNDLQARDIHDVKERWAWRRRAARRRRRTLSLKHN